MSQVSLIPREVLERRILFIRGQKVMVDRDLADLYQVETRVLNQAVKRNAERFPADFMFQLDEREFENWKSQFVISNPAGKMSLRKRPLAFTELGVAMLSSVLRSERAISVNIEIMRAFVRFRGMLAGHKEIVQKLLAFEERLSGQETQMVSLYQAIQTILEPEDRPRIGFL